MAWEQEEKHLGLGSAQLLQGLQQHAADLLQVCSGACHLFSIMCWSSTVRFRDLTVLVLFWG